MSKSDPWVWLAWGALVWLVLRKQSAPAGVPALPWTFSFNGTGYDPNYIPPPTARSIPIASKTQQPAFQGGTTAPSVIREQVIESSSGNPYAGVPFFY